MTTAPTVDPPLLPQRLRAHDTETATTGDYELARALCADAQAIERGWAGPSTAAEDTAFTRAEQFACGNYR